jgi:hypothetical protein
MPLPKVPPRRKLWLPGNASEWRESLASRLLDAFAVGPPVRVIVRVGQPSCS